MTNMRISKQALAIIVSVVLVVGLCPGLAYGEGLVGGQAVATDSSDLSAGILQEGGLNRESMALQASPHMRTLSAGNEDGFVAALKGASERWNGSDSEVKVDVSSYGVSKDRVGALFQRFLNQNGQCFYLTGSIGTSYNPSTNMAISVTLNFDTRYSKSDITTFAATVEEALAGIEAGWSDEQKALYLHDWLVTHCEYDHTLSRASAYDALVVGSAVCQGYALSYDYLLAQAGIDCDVITSRDINHAWNLVTVGGKTYYVDCTWDDPSNVSFKAYCRHGYFLRSKSTFGHVGADSGGSDPDWLDSSGNYVYNDPSAGSSTYYDAAYWNDATTVIPHIGDLWGYVNSSWDGDAVSVRVHDYSNGADRILASGLPGTWKVWGGSAYYMAHYNSLVSDGTSFFVSAPTEIYRIDASGATERVHVLSEAEAALGYVYGLVYDAAASRCVYEIGEAPQGEVKGSRAYVLPVTPVASISLSSKSLSLERGETTTLFADVTPPNATNKAVIWLVADPKIVTVSASGLVKGVSAGTTTVTVKTADGGKSATCTVTVKQTTLSRSNVDFGPIAKQTYTGAAITPAPTVKCGSVPLTRNVDYTLSYKNNVNAGTATITVVGKGNYVGKASVTYTIAAASIAKATVALSKASMAYTGSALKPAVKSVKLGPKALVAGTDYTVTYSSNKNAGTAKATVKGKGNYAGSVSKTFTITKAANPMSVAGKTATVSYSKKKAQTVKASAAYNFKKKAAGAVTYARVASGSSKWLPKVNSKTGAITVKVGAPKGKVQQVKVKLAAKGDANRKSATKTVTVKVKVR